MKLYTLVFAALLGEAARAYKLGDKATGTTDPDVTENCSQWANNISSSDTCEKLEADFNIDYLQLHQWNPSLVVDPCNPIEGWSYCVASPDKTNSLARLVGTEAPTLKNPNYTGSSSASTTTMTTATSSPTSTSSTTTDSTASASLHVNATSTESSSSQQTGNVASSELTNIPILMLFVAFSTLAMQLN